MNTEKQRLNLIIFYAIVLLMGYLCSRIFASFLMPLVWAGILALCAQPLQKRLLTRFHPSTSAVISTVAVAVVLIVPAVLLVVALASQISAGVSGLDTVIAAVQGNEQVLSAWSWIQERLPALNADKVHERLTEVAPKLTRFMAAQAGSVLQASSIFVFKLFVTLFALFFFLRDGRELGKMIRNVLPFSPQRNDELISRTGDMVYAGSMATLVVAAAQGLAGGILFACLGVPAPAFWGVVMAFCSLLPLFGTALVWVPAAIGLILMGAWVKGVIMIVLGMIIVGGMDNVLRPALVSGKTEMNGLVVFISILGGITAFGLVGLVVGPVIVAATVSILQIGASPESTNS